MPENFARGRRCLGPRLGDDLASPRRVEQFIDTLRKANALAREFEQRVKGVRRGQGIDALASCFSTKSKAMRGSSSKVLQLRR